jgi:Flp pilus assembly protein CpaB
MDELEYKDHGRRGKWIVVFGVILALGAGGGAFFLLNQAQQQAATTTVPKVAVVVATRTIPGRKAIEAADVVVKEVPADTVGTGTYADPKEVLDRVPAVTILAGQQVTSNLLASNQVGGQFSILKPEETVSPDSPSWRAVAIAVPDDRAVGGVVQAGMAVDVFLTLTVNIPVTATAQTQAYTDKSTKLAYQDLEVLAKAGTFYIIRVPLGVAEEIEHLQAAGTAQFSLALRPTEDSRIADASRLGATTNLVIERYGLPVPQTFPGQSGTVYKGTATPFPIPTSAPAASASPAPSPSPNP